MKKSKVMTIANKLVAQGFTRSQAMVKAWVLVKMESVETKIAGVTFGNRQKLLDRLTAYPSDMISITLTREQSNPYDKNAVAVVAGVEGKGSAVIGYLPRNMAQMIAPLMDACKAVQGAYKEVRGRYEQYMNLGCVISVRVLAKPQTSHADQSNDVRSRTPPERVMYKYIRPAPKSQVIFEI